MASRAGHYRARYRVDLSPRQCEVLELIARGRTNAEIAEALGITLDGVKWHVREILTKLQVESREAAAAFWQANNRPTVRLQRLLAGLATPAVALRAAIAVAAAGAVIVGGAVLFEALRSDTTPTESEQSAAATVTAASPGPLPRCNQADLALNVRVEPWVEGNLITVDLANNGPPCTTDSAALTVSILPAPAGASSISFPPGDLPTGEQRPVQLVWNPECSASGSVFEIQATVGGAIATATNVVARSCSRGSGAALFPAEKLDVVNGVALPDLASCRTSQLTLQRVPPPTDSGFLIAMRIANNAAPCRLRGSLSIELLDAAGQRVPGVLNNPDSVPVYADLERELTAMPFAWENWCGSPGKFTMRLTLGRLSSSTDVDSRGCGDGRQGSQLRSTQGAFALVPLRPANALDLNSLSPDARRAAEVALSPRWGFVAVVTSVRLESYRDLMCGRQPYAVEDRPVWAVAIFIVSRGATSVPYGATPVDPSTLPNTMLFIVDAATYDSLQTFSPWPLNRAPGSDCP